MRRRMLLRAFCLVVFLFLCSCQDMEPEQPLEKINLHLSWVHQGGFAWTYVAKEKSFFANQGLDVDILPGGPKIDHVSAIMDGEAQFGVMATELLLKSRQEGKPLVLLAMISQRSPISFVSLKKSGLISPKDFIGKKVTFAAMEDKIVYLAMMGKLGLSTDIELRPYSYRYAGILDGSVDVSGAYAIGGVQRLRKAGIELNVCWPDDYGVRFYGQALVTTEDYVRNNPELVRKMVKSFLAGVESTLANPQAAVVATMKYAKEQDEALQTAMIKASLPLIAPGNVELGSIDPQKLQTMNRILYEQKFLNSQDIWKTAYDDRFLSPMK